MDKTFDCTVNSINPESFYICDDGTELYIYIASGPCFILDSNELNSIGINPSTLSIDKAGYLVSKENDKTLYWHRLDKWHGITFINENPANAVYFD